MDKNVILVKPIVQENKSKGGIILLGKVQMYQEGIVVKVGELEQDIQVGDKLYYANLIQTEVDYNGEKHHLINEEYVLVVQRGFNNNLPNEDMFNSPLGQAHLGMIKQQMDTTIKMANWDNEPAEV
jgi:co-chaperonin GroES (HSP10)